MKSKHKEYLLDLLFERREILDMRTKQDWIEANDPNASELDLVSEIICLSAKSDF